MLFSGFRYKSLQSLGLQKWMQKATWKKDAKKHAKNGFRLEFWFSWPRFGQPGARPGRPKSVTKGAQVNLPQLLGPSWATLGTLPGRPGRGPGRPKRGQEHQNSSLKPFFTHFFASFLRVAFRIDFFTLKFATICTETLKI